MPTIGQAERLTQDRVLKLFREELGYRYLGDWSERDNSNVDEDLLSAYLTRASYTPAQISRALDLFRQDAHHPNRALYDKNKAVYNRLRYGVPVKVEAGKPVETVHLINWQAPEENDFAVAEEVTLRGGHERRPDIVLYINGIAVGVLELKNSRKDIGLGIRQNVSNQRADFNEWFFSTIQLVMAGNDSEGLRYGTVGTRETYFLRWKEDEADNTRFKLDKYLLKLCDKTRLLELIFDFVLFDAGVKKMPRVHQYFGLKAAQEYVANKRSGIIWHSQGAGKSILMVLLAKWILENNPHARVVVVTDRTELDKQIERVFTEAEEPIYRTNSGKDLVRQLAQAQPRLLCSLVHKFGLDARGLDEAAFNAFIRELESNPMPVIGEVFVFVDECHRTQSGRLHKVMKAVTPGAVFIGFTGTPLLKQDRETSLEVFGSYIHTYKYSEAVEDGVVLDLVYEARDIDQTLGSQDRIDQWFDAKTRGLNDWQKDELKKHWGTLQKVLSSRSRMERVVEDIIFDFGTKPRLSSEHGNAMLVASSIYEACQYFRLFEKTYFKGKCAIVTSYDPKAGDVSLEDSGDNKATEKQVIYDTYTELLKNVAPFPGMSAAESYEEAAKDRFIKQPALMKLLIVVDKLLTGFDAPSCTYLYIDKSMQDHGLFQAICRTNRLDGDDKDYGYIVDYKDLFKKVEKAIAVYTSELDHSADGPAPEVLLKDRLDNGREKLEGALEALAVLCEDVEPPRGDLEYIHYFCGNTEVATDLDEREPQRIALYKGVVALIRAYGNIADDLPAAGYSDSDIEQIKASQRNYLNLREMIRRAAGETLDLKPFEADMRHLIDTYIEAKAPRIISPFDGMGLLDVIVKTGIADAIASELGGLKGNRDAIAETIENNVRTKISRDHMSDPAFYEKMSALLDEVVRLRRQRAIKYEEYLNRISEVVKTVQSGSACSAHPQLDTPGKIALYNNLKQHLDALGVASTAGQYNGQDPALDLALQLDDVIRNKRPADWRDVVAKQLMVKGAMFEVLKNESLVELIYPLVVKHTEY